MSLPKGLYKKSFNGHEVIVSDYRGLTDNEMLIMVQALEQLILEENKPSSRLVYAQGVELPMPVRIFLRKMGGRVKHIPSKIAVISTSTAKRLLLQSYNRIIGGTMRFYDEEKDAIAYLTS